MAQVLIRNLNPETIQLYKERARRKGHSLQTELKAVLEREGKMTMEEFRRSATELRERIAARGIPQGDSSDLIREDRDSR